jgi:hypothetical protein
MPGEPIRFWRVIRGDDLMTSEESNDSRLERDKNTSEPHHARLPGFVSDQDIGLGEVIKRATSAVGIQPCGGCNERAARLNRWMVFSPWRRR